MKPMTIWQRLDRALLLLILLLFVAVGLAFWVALERSSTSQRSDQLSGNRDRVYYDVMLMFDSLRGMSGDPKNELERKRHREAEQELESKLEQMQRAFKEVPELLTPVKNLSDFARGTAPGTYGNFQNKVLAIADTDPKGALSFFDTNYPALSHQRDQLFQQSDYDDNQSNDSAEYTGKPKNAATHN